MRIILFIFICLGSSGLFGQNYLMSRNNSSFHLATQYSKLDNISLFAISPGYTFNGKFTIGAGFGSQSLKNIATKSRSTQIYLSYLPIKQENTRSPFTVEIGSSYQSNFYSNYDPINSISLFGILHSDIYFSKSSKLIPGLGALWVNSGGYSGVSTVFMVTLKVSKFYFEPSWISFKGNSTFNFVIGHVFSDEFDEIKDPETF